MNTSEAKAEVRDESQPRCGYMAESYGHTGGAVLEPCEKCGGEKVCGPFGHYCLKCHPFMKIHCIICEMPRFKCCC